MNESTGPGASQPTLRTRSEVHSHPRQTTRSKQQSRKLRPAVQASWLSTLGSVSSRAADAWSPWSDLVDRQFDHLDGDDRATTNVLQALSIVAGAALGTLVSAASALVAGNGSSCGAIVGSII